MGLKACVQLFSNSPPIHNFTFAAEGGLVEEEFAPTFHFRLKNPQILKNQHLTFTNPQKSTFHFHLKDQPFTLKILKNQPFTFASKFLKNQNHMYFHQSSKSPRPNKPQIPQVYIPSGNMPVLK